MTSIDGQSASSLKWSAQYETSSLSRNEKNLSGDKISLPQSALEQILSASPLSDTRQQQLPHPLTFRLVNPNNNRITHAGIREFSANEGEVNLSPFLREGLGLQDGARDPITVRATELPKGTYARLRPLAAGYDVEDWKALLERHLRDHFTTLTVNEILRIPSIAPPQRRDADDFNFLVDKLEPESDAICIVDTDLQVDIEPLNEEQARETLQRQLAKGNEDDGDGGGISRGGVLQVSQSVQGQVRPGHYVDYEIPDWNSSTRLEVSLTSSDDDELALLISPFSSRHRDRPRLDQYVFGDLEREDAKRIQLRPTNVELQGSESINVSIHSLHEAAVGDQNPLYSYTLQAKSLPAGAAADELSEEVNKQESDHDPDDIQCKNCFQWVPQRTLFLHENFCLRNNVFCPKCQRVFQKRSSEWASHWHCAYDNSNGDDERSKQIHDSVFHEQRHCPSCDFTGDSFPSLAQHRTTTCPGRLILCRFCHLTVPQQGEEDPSPHDVEVLLSGLTPHEYVDGGRTTECYLCNKILRLKDMQTHLRHHDLNRVSKPPPTTCVNPNCGRTVAGPRNNNTIGLCAVCFGPLHASVYDPDGSALRRRIERRYLTQMLSGCGKPWCQNNYCKTGRKNAGSDAPSLTSKEITPLVKPLVNELDIGASSSTSNTKPIWFCVDHASHKQRALAEGLAAEGNYELPWCIAAAEAGASDLDGARDWLENRAPKRGEKIDVGVS